MVLGYRYEGKLFASTAKGIRVSQHLIVSLDKPEILDISVASAYGTLQAFGLRKKVAPVQQSAADLPNHWEPTVQ